MRLRRYSDSSAIKAPVEEWMLGNLWLYGNCLISKKRIRISEGEESFLEILKQRGFVCSLRKSAVDKNYYIIELNRVLKKANKCYQRYI